MLNKIVLFILGLICSVNGITAQAGTLESSLENDRTYQFVFTQFTQAHGKYPDAYNATYNPQAFGMQNTALDRFVISYVALKNYMGGVPARQTEATLVNSNRVAAGLFVVRQAMTLDLAKKFQMTRKDAKRRVDDFFALMDVRGANPSFSGLIFFQDFLDAFQNEKWMNYAKALEGKLNDLLENEIKSEKNLFELAVESTDGDEGAAIKLLGLTMSRDTATSSYFRYFQKEVSNQDFRAVTRINQLARTYSEWLQWKTMSQTDTFNYPKGLIDPTLKTYYFWSNAYLTMNLLEKGYTGEQAEYLSGSLAHYYKLIRRYGSSAGRGFGSGFFLGAIASAFTGLLPAMFLHQHGALSLNHPVVFATGVAIGYATDVLEWSHKHYLRDRAEVRSTSEAGSRFASQICDGILSGQIEFPLEGHD